MRVEFNNPEFPSDIEVDVEGLLLINGQSKELTDEEEEAYLARNGVSAKEGLSRVTFIKVDGVGYTPPVEVVETPVVESTENPADTEGGES